MSKLIALDDGHGINTGGKRTPELPNGMKSELGRNYMNENLFNRAVVKYLDAHLKRCGFRTLLVAPTDGDTPLDDRVAKANNANVDLYLSVHANANTGTWGSWGGTETYVWMNTDKTTSNSEKIGKILHKYLMKGTPLRDRGVRNGNHLFVIRKSKMPSVLVECAFMDNLTEAKLLLSDAFRRECARELAMGLCEYYKVKFVEEASKPSAPKTSTPKPSGQIYRVRTSFSDPKSQKGAFTNLANAKELADSLKSKGYRVFDEKGKVVYDPSPKKQDDIWYRVRKSWADSKSQIGAFHDLGGAKELADSKAKEGYKVFDEKGKAVYSPKVENAKPEPKPATPKPEPKPEPKPVTPAPKPEPKPQEDAHKGHTDIVGKSVVSATNMAQFVKSKNPNAKNIDEIARAFEVVGKRYGIRGDIAFCQAIIETGWFKFDGGTAVTPDQYNYCGLGVTSKGMKGASFSSIEDGVSGQIQHLFAYATKSEIPSGERLVDPRFNLVTRGVAPHWEDLSNKWAMNANYGSHILDLYKQLVNFNYVPPVVEEEKDNDVEEQLSMWKKIVDYVFAKIAEMFGKK
jgi:N-acetylmuramoyl-L-alanine amidase/flagellum-specific peptidoglycan hydrolase FlgJ